MIFKILHVQYLCTEHTLDVKDDTETDSTTTR